MHSSFVGANSKQALLGVLRLWRWLSSPVRSHFAWLGFGDGVKKVTMAEAWIAYGVKVLNVCSGVLDQTKLEDDEKNTADPKVVALALMCRTANNWAAMRLLIENEFVVEARTMARCCYENLFWIAGLTADSAGFVKKVVGADATSRLKRGNELLQWTQKQNSAIDFEAPLKAFLDDLKTKNPTTVDIQYKAAADAGKIGDGYIIYRVLSTDAAHPSATSLSRHLEYDEESAPPVMTFSAMPLVDDGEVEETLEFACSALLGVCVGANKFVGGTPAGKQLHELFTEYKTLSNASKAARDKLKE